MSQHGVVQTQAPVRLDDVMIDSPNPPIYFSATASGVGSIALAANTTYRIGTLLAYNATTNKYVPYLHTDTAADIPDCVLMSEIVTGTTATDHPGLLAKGVARRNWLIRGAGVVGDPFNDTTLPPVAVALARNRGLFILRTS